MLYTIKTDNNYIFQLYTIYTMNIKPHKLNKYLQLYLTTTKQTIFYVKTTKPLFKISKIKNNGKNENPLQNNKIFFQFQNNKKRDIILCIYFLSQQYLNENNNKQS